MMGPSSTTPTCDGGWEPHAVRMANPFFFPEQLSPNNTPDYSGFSSPVTPSLPSTPISVRPVRSVVAGLEKKLEACQANDEAKNLMIKRLQRSLRKERADTKKAKVSLENVNAILSEQTAIIQNCKDASKLQQALASVVDVMGKHQRSLIYIKKLEKARVKLRKEIAAKDKTIFTLNLKVAKLEEDLASVEETLAAVATKCAMYRKRASRAKKRMKKQAEDEVPVPVVIEALLACLAKKNISDISYTEITKVLRGIPKCHALKAARKIKYNKLSEDLGVWPPPKVKGNKLRMRL